MAGDTVNLQEKFDAFSEHWSPKVVGELNGQQVKLAKLKRGVRLAPPCAGK
jgi:hypothetical protein